MRCACGFENEGGNKFCNMCGMALPAEGDAGSPMERAPLDLDLSLDLGDGAQSSGLDGSELGLDLDLGSSPAEGSFDLGGFNIDPAEKPTELDLDLGSSEAGLDSAGGLNIESQPISDGELSFDLHASPGGLETGAPPIAIDDEISFDLDKSTSGGLDIDLDVSPPAGLDLGSEKDSGDLSFDLVEPDLPPMKPPVTAPVAAAIPQKPKTQPVSASSSNATPTRIESRSKPKPVPEPEPEPVIDVPDSLAEPVMEFSADTEAEVDLPPRKDSPPKRKEIKVEEFSIEVGENSIGSSNFDLGDLDATGPTISSAKERPVPTTFEPETSTSDDSSFLDQFLAPPVETSGPKTSRKKTGSEEAANSSQFDTTFNDPVETPESDFSESVSVYSDIDSSSEPEQMSGEMVSTTGDIDDDLAGLIMGIEGKSPPKPLPPTKPTIRREGLAPVVPAAAPEISAAEDLEGLQIPELETIADGDSEGSDAPISSEVASLEPVVPPPLSLSPEEQLEECLKRLADAKDPDERYSVVLELKELKLAPATATFIQLLGDELKDIREVAAGYLGETAAKNAVKPLIACLNSGDASLKFISARSLGNIRDEAAMAPLVKLLEEDNDDLRYVALESLGKIGATAALKPVAAFLKARNHDLRFVACEALGSLRDSQTVALLLPMLKDPDFEVRLKSIESLGKIGSVAACDQLLVVLGEDNERMRLATIQALGQIKNANAVDALIDVFGPGTPQVKEKILWSLGEIGNERAVEPLLGLSQHFTQKLIFLALEAFAKIKSAKASRYVLGILDKKDHALRLKAIEALGEIAEKATAGNMIPFLEGPEPEIKMAAAKALGRIGNPIAIDPLVGRLTDSERDVRLQAIEALGLIKGAKAIPPLINALHEQDSQIINKAEWALCEMQDLAVEPLNKSLLSESPDVIPSIVRVLGKIGSIRSIFPLLKVLEAAEGGLKPVIADSLLTIDNHLTDGNPISVILKEGYAWAQFSVAEALATMGDERAFPLMIKIARETLNDKDLKKLAGIPDKRILECSGQILHLIRMNVARLFAQVGTDKAIPVIMKYFGETDNPQRQWCVEALGGIQTDGALDALVDVLKRPEYQIPLDLLSKQLIANKSRKLVEKLILSASHPSEVVRMSIAVVLGETRDPRAIRTLSQLVKDSADKVRSASIEAIGKIGTTAAVAPAIEALRDSIEAVRAKAAQVLGELRDTAAVEFLERTTKDASEMVRRIAVKSLAGMADARVPDILIQSLADKAETVRCAAVESLGTRKDRVAIPHLIKTLEDSAEAVRERTAASLALIADTQAIMPMLERLDDPSPLVPLACSEAIVSFKTRSYPVLVEALKHDEERIRRHSCDLLVRIGEDNLVHELLRLVKDRNNFLRENIARILGRIGDGRVVDSLVQMLADRSSSVRRTAAESLGALRDIRALVALKRTERDQSKEVRQAASTAVQEILKANKLN